MRWIAMIAAVWLFAMFFICWVIFITKKKKLFLESLNQKHVAITGGSSGIGLALAKRCLKEGAFVTLMARNKDNLFRAREEVLRIGYTWDKILLKVVDASDALAVTSAIQETFQWRPIDILICNAGVGKLGLLEQVTLEDLDMTFRINFMGSVYPVHAVLPLMKQRSFTYPSSIVFINSLSSLSHFFGTSLYLATKYAQRGLAELLRIELKPYNIQVNIVFPGYTETPMLDGEDKEDPWLLKAYSEICFYDRKYAQRSDEVAFRTMEGVKSGDFLITTNREGLFLSALARGMVPAETISRGLLELFSMVPIRVFTFALYMYIRRLLHKYYKS